MEVNKRLKALRNQKKCTLQQLADLLNVSISTYCGYETERTNKHWREPSLDKLKILAKFYNVSIDYVTGNSDLVNNHDENYIIYLIQNTNKIDSSLKPYLIEKIHSIVCV